VISQQRLKRLLRYDRKLGVFIWRVTVMTGRYGKSVAAKRGEVAGSVGARGYVLIGIDGTVYRACRLVWLYVYGIWPTNDMDHINGDRSDDRFANLREATRSENNQNLRGPRSSNKSGFLGVCRYRKKWHAQIKVNGERIHLGYFNDPEEAHLVYLAAKLVMHPYANFTQ